MKVKDNILTQINVLQLSYSLLLSLISFKLSSLNVAGIKNTH